MKQFLKRLAQQEMTVYMVAALVSLVFSAWLGYREVVVNNDAICYLMSAKEMARGGIKEGMQLCPAKWPFFSFLIYLLNQATSLNHLYAANILDAIFSMVTVLTFVALVKKMGGSVKTLWFAAFVILFAHQFNSIRQYIVRDHGYWAFYMLSIYAMALYYERPRWRYVTAWVISLVVATLFRIEGIVFLVLAPLLVFFNKIELRQRGRAEMTTSIGQQAVTGARLYLPLLIVLVVFGIWLLLKDSSMTVNWGRFAQVFKQVNSGMHNVAWRYQNSKQAMLQFVLPPESAKEASVLWPVTIVVGYLINIIQNVYWVCALLVVYAWTKSLMPLRHPIVKILMAYLVLNVGITALFYGQHLFLSKRYLIGLSLVLWLWVPFAYDELSRVAKDTWPRFCYYFSMLLIISSTVGVFVGMGPSKQYIRQASDWVQHRLNPNSRFYTNDYQLLYYTQYDDRNFFKLAKQYENLSKALQHSEQYDLMAIQIGRQDKQLASMLATKHFPRIKTFANKHGDAVIVYETKKRSAE